MRVSQCKEAVKSVIIRLFILTPLIDDGLLGADVLHHTGDLLSRCGRVLQVGVDLVVPVSINQLLSGGHITGHLLTVPEPVQLGRSHTRCTSAWRDDHHWPGSLN